jgi:hypothetical protein
MFNHGSLIKNSGIQNKFMIKCIGLINPPVNKRIPVYVNTSLFNSYEQCLQKYSK